MIEINSKIKYAHISPKKVQPFLRDIRGRLAGDVLTSLKYSPSKAGKLLYKLIASAIANAENNYNLKPQDLKVKKLTVDSGPQYKRYWLRSHGSADVRLKRTSHLMTSLEALVRDPEKVKFAKPKTKKADLEDKESKESKKADTKLKSESKDTIKGQSQKATQKAVPRTTNK
ncbi:MAG: 50S ribosomal protein L22 [Patescibacteria group bacterium]|nr:50S ribosomal protein L22 [Patescibacteria group bacterium]